jgi:hypothetical protein
MERKNDQIQHHSPDIVFIWSNMIVAILQSILFFKNMFKVPTHVQIRYDQMFDISAEPSGVKLVLHSDLKKYRKSEKYKCPLELSGQKLDEFYDICDQYLGKKYDFFLYFRWHLHISLAYVPFFLIVLPLFLAVPLKKTLLVAVIYFIGGGLFDLILKILSKRTWHCNELTSTIYKKIGINFGYETNDKSAPYWTRLLVRFCEWKEFK